MNTVEHESHTPRQPDPQSPAHSQPPSLLAYGVSLIVSVLLCWAALDLTEDRRELWAALLLNIGCGLGGAILVFMALERRFRSAELRRLGGVIPSWYSQIARPYQSAKLNYARLLLGELTRIHPPNYLRRFDFAECLRAYPKGFCLVGPAGTGKTTEAQDFAISLLNQFLRNPRESPVPILIPMRRHFKASLEDNLWYEGMLHYGINSDTAAHIRRRGKRVLILDGLDESAKRDQVPNEIAEILDRDDDTVIVATSRSTLPTLPLPTVTFSLQRSVPPLTPPRHLTNAEADG